MSLASLNLIQQTTTTFSLSVYRFIVQTGSIAEKLENIRKLYDAANIKNRIEDGTVPFPEDMQKLKHGITVEFRSVQSSWTCRSFLSKHSLMTFAGMFLSNIRDLILMPFATYPSNFLQGSFV